MASKIVIGLAVLGSFALGLLVRGFFIPEPKEASVEPEPTSEVVESTQAGRVLKPAVNLDAPSVKETHLFGEYIQEIGDYVVGLKLLSTEDFGPYTVFSMYGRPGEETVRMGFFHVSEDGDLVLNFRFREDKSGELVSEPSEEIWDISVEYPFIQLSRNDISLITTVEEDGWSDVEYDPLEEYEIVEETEAE
jgi:hypothetical protein